MAGPERLGGRDGAIWTAYVGGATQEAIATEYNITQQRVSQVLAEVRATIGDAPRMDAALLAAERTDALLAAVWPAAMEGDPRAVGAALRVLERQARALGTDAPEPLRVALERRLDDDAELVTDALAAALDVLDLGPERQALAVAAATAKLTGGEPPPRPVSAVEVSAEPGLMAEFREFAEREGFDPDGLDDEDDDDD